MQKGILSVFLLTIFTIIPGAVPASRAQQPAAAQPLRVMTFNIRYNNPDDGRHAWPHRKERVANLIRFHQADLLGVQEALRGQLDDLAEQLPEYAWFGVGRDDGKDEGEFSAIFYRPERFELLEHDTFWLSETPEVPGSKSWDAAITRVATWGRFRDKETGETFYHFNTHFDHRGEQAREESAKLLVRKIQEIAGDAPVILMGDFNFVDTTPGYAVLTDLLKDTYHDALYGHYGPERTFSGFEVTNTEGRRIDYIFVSEGIETIHQGTLSDQWNGDYPSDHLPVLAEVVISE